MSKWKIRDESNGNVNKYDTRQQAEDQAAELRELGADVVVLPPETETAADGGEPTAVPDTDAGSTDGIGETVDATVEPVGEDDPDPSDELPTDPSVDTDPVEWMPAHFVDEIQGVPTVNRKGYAVIASKYGVSVTADPVTLPSETDHEYAEFRAIAVTEDGQEYSGFGSAHVDRQDGDDEFLLAELAETRAMKRATAWATGVGMTAVEELRGSLPE